jgi:hypothetical protein
MIRAQHSLMVAIPARHVERADTEIAHVTERHRLDRLVEASDRHYWYPALPWITGFPATP